jgi:hypothetical protein
MLLGDTCHQALSQRCLVGTISATPPLTLHHGEPWLDVLPPRTMPRRVRTPPRGCLASQACPGFLWCRHRLSRTICLVVLWAARSPARCSRTARHSPGHFRAAVRASTGPGRGATAAHRCKAPQRRSAWSTSTGRPAGAALVGPLRGRGGRRVVSSTHRTRSLSPSGRGARGTMALPWAAKTASRGP